VETEDSLPCSQQQLHCNLDMRSFTTANRNSSVGIASALRAGFNSWQGQVIYKLLLYKLQVIYDPLSLMYNGQRELFTWQVKKHGREADLHLVLRLRMAELYPTTSPLLAVINCLSITTTWNFPAEESDGIMAHDTECDVSTDGSRTLFFHERTVGGTR
jgi:hypothetical protein